MPAAIWRWCSLAALVLCQAAATLLGDPRWLVNDDLAMSWFASGTYTGDPTGQLVFVGRMVGLPIARLYGLAPSLPWYALAMVGAGASALWAVAWLADTRRLQLAWCAAALPAAVWLAQTPNFTATAILCCSVGLMLVPAAAVLGRRGLGVVGPALITLGYSWRTEALLVAALLVLAPFGLAVGCFGRRRDQVKRLLVLAAAATGLVLASHAFTHSCVGLGDSACADWEDFHDYNRVRGTFHGSPRIDALGAVADTAVGWTPATFLLFANFSSLDHPVFGIGALAVADEEVPQVTLFSAGSTSERVRDAGPWIERVAPWLLFWGLLIVLPGWLVERRRIRLVLQFTAAVSAAGTLIIVSAVRLPLAIVVGVSISFGLALVVLDALVPRSAQRDRRPVQRDRRPVQPLGRRAIPVSAVGATVLLVLLGPLGFVEQRQESDRLRERSTALGDPFGAPVDGRLVMAGGEVANYIVQNPYAVDGPADGMMLAGWPVFSPNWYLRKAAQGFPEDTYGAMLGDGDRVYLMAQGLFAQATADFLVEQLGLAEAVEATCVEEVIPGICIWSFDAVPPAATPT